MLEGQRNAAGGAPVARTPANGTLGEVTRRYYSMWLGYSFAGGFLYGVYPLFLRSRGLDQFQINSVLAVYFVVMFLTDVPTGAFADAMGRRRSFVLGCALRVAAFLLYFCAHRYAAFLLAESIDGVGTTFCNGAIDAWGVDALDAAGFVGLKDRLFSRISQLTNLGFVGSAIIGAYVADIDIAYPWLLGAAGYLFAGMAAASLMRGERERSAGVNLRALPGLVALRVMLGLRRGFRSRPVLLLSSASALTFAAWAPYWLEWPQLFNDRYGVGIWIVGWLYALFTLARMAGAEAVVRFGVTASKRGARLVGLTLVAGALLFGGGALAGRPNLALVSLLVMNLCAGAMQPLGQTWFNEQIDSEERATLLSFSSTFGTLGGSLGLLVGGRVADAYGIPAAWKLGALILLAAAPCYWAVRRASAGVAIVPAAS
ncbi:MAG TPA: MFS transporter [Candidatus Binataceae bacterium]|nr:MFS transporter [Candidatus Binataceae bacterium]